jgi:hypothetical protein
LKRTLEALEALRSRPEGWNGYDAMSPLPQAIDNAVRWITTLGEPAQHVTSSAEGEVVFEWWGDPCKLTVYISPDSEEYIYSDSADIATMTDGVATPQRVRDLLP